MDIYGGTIVGCQYCWRVGLLTNNIILAWKTAVMQQSTAHLATTQDPIADIENAVEPIAEEANGAYG